jgi:ABC-type glycerol-3-phosphate transport system substrate-binding protein
MKNNKLKRTLALALSAAAMIGTLAGCGGKTDGAGGDSSSSSDSEYVYVPSYVELSTTDYISGESSAVYGGKLYYSGREATSVGPDGTVYTDEDDENYWTYYTSTPALFSVDLSTGESERLEGYVAPALEEGVQGSAYVNNLCVTDSGEIWVAENSYSYHYDVPEGVTEDDDEYWNYYVDDGEQYYLRKLDSTGAELLNLDISYLNQDSDYFYIGGFAVDGTGNLYITDGNETVYAFDSEGQELFEVTCDSYINGLLKLSDGSIAATGYMSGSYGVQKIDAATKAFGDELDMPTNVYNTYDGGGDYLFYCGSDTDLYGYNATTGECEKILNWINCDVDCDDIMTVTAQEDGTIFAISRSWADDNYVTEAVTMVRTPSSEVPQKITLTYACVYLDWTVRSQIINFNKSNDTYRIEVKDYSEYNTDDDYSAGLTKLTTEIIAGNVPDLLDVSELPIEQYAATGLLEDLYPYMDADSELNRSAFVPAVLSALETDGKLYQMGSSFAVSTVIGDPAVVGEGMGWTLDDLNAVLDEYPDADVFDYYYTASDMLTTACAYSMDDFVDWQTGECSFDSDGFVKVLEFCKRFPLEFDWDNYDYDDEYEDTPSRIANGKQLLIMTDISGFQSFQMYKAMFGGNIVYKGFPCAAKNGNALTVSGGIAMTTSCKDKDGAWQFIRSMLTEDYQSSGNIWNFPTNQAAFDAKLQEAMKINYYTDPETGEQVEQSTSAWCWGDLEVEIYAIRQDEADEILNMIDSVTNVYSYDTSITDIITDEAAAYFNGEKSAEETAKLIQSRVSLYVNEKR